MADLDVSLWVCEDCLSPVEGSSRCPACGGCLFMCDPLAFQIWRTLFERGWQVESIKVRGHSSDKNVAVTFRDISPGYSGVNRMQCQLTEDQKPVCVTSLRQPKVAAFRHTYEWAMEAPVLRDAVPFNRMVCELCTDQHDVEWLHGQCSCPCAGLLGSDKPGATGPHWFSKGFPRKCPYIAEQLMTKQDRVDELAAKSKVPGMFQSAVA